jgi:hypothetical protein
MNFLISAIIKILGAPLLGTVADIWKKKLEVETNKDNIKERLAAQALDLEVRQAELHTQLRIYQTGVWYAVENMFGYVTLIFYSKVLLWDKALGWGTTDGLKGDIADWAGMVIAFFFAKRGVENAIKIWKSR